MEADDMELVREYAANRTEQAFRTLVERHINLVYRVALRQTQNSHLAEDVTQAVFIVLAQKAASIPPDTILAGWLFRATRFAAANVRRAEARREQREQTAAQMEPSPSSEPELEQIAPLLNEALAELSEQDRAAILLRFFESKSMEEVGRTLGTTEGAAKMRLARAVEKLRKAFRRHGQVLPTATVLALLSAQASQAAPAGLAASVAASALFHQSSASTLIAKGTLKIMAQTQAKKLAVAALALVCGGVAVVVVQQLLSRSSSNGAGDNTLSAATPQAQVKAAAPATNEAEGKILLFRGRPSWGRHPDFEDVLADLGLDFEVKPAELMASADLSRYRAIVIPGAQSTSQFYAKYVENAARFNEYVTNGGILVLELNGAERSGLPMPGNVNMVLSPAKENLITVPNHPILTPMAGRPIRANFASHGYLIDVPTDALVLATEAVDGEAIPDRPTFVEYGFGKGRVLAACQCFHDRDNSGRGPLMQTVLRYAAERKWYARQ
jgi:RNA polymerase sigma factor (sigma-70 family)